MAVETLRSNLVVDQPAMGRPRIRPPQKIHGGKYYLITAHNEAISWCCDPADVDLSVDGCGGGGTFGLNATSPIVLYNDLDPKKYNLFWVLRDHAAEFQDALTGVRFSRERWEEARLLDTVYGETMQPGSVTYPNVAAAVNFVVRSRMSRGGIGKTFGTSARSRGGNPEYLNAWITSVAQMPRVASLVSPWLLTNWTVQRLLSTDLAKYSRVLWYIDPPYWPDSRTAKDVYDYEMSPEEHADLIRLVKACRGVVAICGYHCDLYDHELAGWTLFEWPVKNNSGQGKRKQARIECLWVNRPVTRRPL